MVLISKTPLVFYEIYAVFISDLLYQSFIFRAVTALQQ